MGMFVEWWMYVPAAAWLTVCAVAGVLRKPIPTWVMLVVWCIAPIWIAWGNGWVSAVVSAVVSVLVFGFFVFTGVVKRSTTVSLVPAVAALPPLGWFPLAAGLLLAGVVSLLMVKRAHGGAHVGGVAVGTLHAMGVGAPGPKLFGLGKPRLGELPVPSTPRYPRVPFAAMLAAPMWLAAVTSAFVFG